MHFTLLSALSSLLAATSAQSTFTPARPPSLPLAVKSPYLSTWLPAGSDGDNGGYLPGQWPQFYTGQVLGWTGLVRVDNETFTWMGAPLNIPSANQTGYEYTSTRSIFTIEVNNKVSLKVTFLSPLTPKDLRRQSLVFSYMNVDVSSLDGSGHDVQIYTDVSAEWISGDVSVTAKWDFGLTNDIVYHKLSREDQQVFSEVNDRAEWGNFSAFYPSVKENYGVPLDTRNRYYTKSDWELFCAAIASETTRDMFISDLAKSVNETPTSKPLTDLYQTSDATFPPGLTFKARPVVGGLFALLLLEQAKGT
ncbi:hypothetical protein N0V87_009488 [Didymella glomerata]|uniref:Glutaminase A N-terminal domain-containing protein n=1 Tax=Didymella glomerata TaxID=749621 RepID=A0A9W8WS16_9PLEO|nr:hypothetical protein N0V87_009488 [Didymella glomerata]